MRHTTAMPGVAFSETMAGAFALTDAELTDAELNDGQLANGRGHLDRPMSFTIEARSGSLWRVLRDRELDIAGEIDALGFADHRALEGKLSVPEHGRLHYAFSFRDNLDRLHRFVGDKVLSLAHLQRSLTTLRGHIEDERGGQVARALLRFDVRSDLVRLLRSFRLYH